ncbi:hypothetical protein JCM10213_002740 [Rhodosporidiobolus nylandii]
MTASPPPAAPLAPAASASSGAPSGLAPAPESPAESPASAPGGEGAAGAELAGAGGQDEDVEMGDGEQKPAVVSGSGDVGEEAGAHKTERGGAGPTGQTAKQAAPPAPAPVAEVQDVKPDISGERRATYSPTASSTSPAEPKARKRRKNLEGEALFAPLGWDKERDSLKEEVRTLRLERDRGAATEKELRRDVKKERTARKAAEEAAESAAAARTEIVSDLHDDVAALRDSLASKVAASKGALKNSGLDSAGKKAFLEPANTAASGLDSLLVKLEAAVKDAESAS